MKSSVRNVTRCNITLKNDVEIDVSPLKARLSSYLELMDRIIVKTWTLIEGGDEQSGYDLSRNIFCYSKEDGGLLWQIEHAYHPRTRELLDGVFKNIKLYIKQSDGSYERFGDDEDYPWDDIVAGTFYPDVFRHGVDRIAVETWSDYPNEYWVDCETGKLEWSNSYYKGMPMPED